MAVDDPQTDTILNFITDRQRRIGKNARGFLFVTLLLSALATALSMLSGNEIIPQPQDSITSGFTSLHATISYVASVLSQVSMWFFSIISLFFPAFISATAYWGTAASESPLKTRSHRWLSLGASTLAPIVMFAFAWVQLPNIRGNGVNLDESIVVLAFALLIGGLLIAASFRLVDRVPRQRLPVKFALYSSILYISMLMAFGLEQSVLILCTLLGILFYLIWDTDKIPDLMSEIALFDLEPALADRVRDLMTQDDRLLVSKVEASIRRERLDSKQKELEQDRLESDISREESRRHSIEAVEKARQRQLEKIDEAITKQQDTRIETTAAALDILMEQYDKALTVKQEQQLASIKDGSTSLTAEELEKELSEVMQGLSGTGIPEIAAQMKKNIEIAYDEQVARLTKVEDTPVKQSFDELPEAEQLEIANRLKETTGITNRVKYLKRMGFDMDEAKRVLTEVTGEFSEFTFTTTWHKEK